MYSNIVDASINTIGGTDIVVMIKGFFANNSGSSSVIDFAAIAELVNSTLIQITLTS
jgi:hypothetical protein